MEETMTTYNTLTLPEPPLTTSPVPWLTSIHATPERGPYGDARYPGNCGGYLIRDLIHFFGSRTVLDPMAGSGTCLDVCTELEIPCESLDLRTGFDATDAANFHGLGPFDFIWLHPPYWNMIRYSDDQRCLSNVTIVDDFLDRLQAVIRNCRGVLSRDGRIAILLAGMPRRGRYFPLPYLALDRALDESLWPACPEIIRPQYATSSSRRAYSGSFIPQMHEVCFVLKPDQ